MMDIESYRIYMNRPTTLMGFPIVYCVPDSALAEMADTDLESTMRQEHPILKGIKTVRHGGWTYIGVITGGDDGQDD